MRKTFLFLLLLTVAFITNGQEQVTDTIRYDQYGKKVDRTPLNAETRNGILVFETKDKDYKLWFDIRLQTDGQFFFNDQMNPIGDGFTIRRARFAVKSQLTKNWLAELDLNFSNGVFELEDAIIGYNFNNGLVSRVGNFKEQFSMSQTSSSRYIPFMERAMVVGALAPSRHLGWDATYNHNYFMAAGGVFFQTIEDGEALLNVQDNNKDFGRDQGYSLTSKIVAQPFSYNRNYGVHLGYGYSFRTPKTDAAPSEYGKARYSVRSLSNINRKKYLDTDLIDNLKNERLSNIEIAGFYKGFAFQTEFINNLVTQTNTTETLNFGGFYAQATYLLFGGRQVYDKNQGEFNQPDRGKKWGDIELALRYDFINLNDKQVMGGSAEGYTIGLNFYASKNFKLQMNYSYLNHDRFANGKGKLFVGNDIDGNLTKDPTKVAVANGKAGHDYSQFGLRAEINF